MTPKNKEQELLNKFEPFVDISQNGWQGTQEQPIENDNITPYEKEKWVDQKILNQVPE